MLLSNYIQQTILGFVRTYKKSGTTVFFYDEAHFI